MAVPRTAAQIRSEFLDFFRKREHQIVAGSPVVPYDDPTLLFINAGMNQFKDVFLATGSRPYNRAADTQPCIRAGGKHNDLDDVGADTYHHTFFEMLGNWSFGDYFKREAIQWAWELLTKVWGLDKSRLHATYFGGDEKLGLEPDLEARDLWAEVTDINPDHIHPGGVKDNFWEMGATGPCGPCSEIHIDLTPDKSGKALVNAGDARVIEIWNLVFIQFNRGPDGKLTPLPDKHVDTGMGFERVCALLQGKSSNYDTDIFTPIFTAIREVTGAPAYTGTLPDSVAPVSSRCPETAQKEHRLKTGATAQQTMIDVSYRVIADHIRCLTFALTDGAVPDREGRGYVLRRILRRAVRYGWQYLNMHEPFLYRLVPAVVDSLGDAFPKLKDKPGEVAAIIREEEESFDRTLDRGIALLEEAAARGAEHHNEIRGEDAFKLHDTYGFPIDLTEIMAAERGMQVDIGEYERLMDEARERARAAGVGALTAYGTLQGEMVTPFGPTDDSPKYQADTVEAAVKGIVRFESSGVPAVLSAHEHVHVGDNAGLVCDRTCFYAEQGGQVGDVGLVEAPHLRFEVDNTLRFGETVVHFGTLLMGQIGVGDRLKLTVDFKRIHTKQNHTATHVMNWALREVLGDRVQQRGSLVDPDKTRFDFSHNAPVAPEQLERVESLCNERIEQNLTVYDKQVPQAQALKINSLRAVFGEKYPELVRVVSVGVPVDELLAQPEDDRWPQYSIEFCGGTHLKSTAEIEKFAITTEESVAKGVRRVVAVTGLAAQMATELGAELLRRAASLKVAAGPRTGRTDVAAGPRTGRADVAAGPRTGRADVAAGVSPAVESQDAFDPASFAAQLNELQQAASETALRVADRIRLRDAFADLQTILKKHQKAEAAQTADVVQDKIAELLATAETIGNTTVVVAEMPDVPLDQLKNGADSIKQKRASAAILFGVWVGRTSSPPTEPEAQARDKPTAGKALLLAAMSNDLIKKGLKAGDLVKSIAPIVKGGGGGPPTMAQAGGKDPQRIAEALEAGKSWIEDKLR
jgi:alanyl-tRNA synthetase